MGCLKLEILNREFYPDLPENAQGKVGCTLKVIQGYLSVDPLASKYPSLTPYNYCLENPIKLIDPNGEYPAIPYGDPPKRPILKGILTTAGGVVAVVSGTIACATGVGAPAGAVAISLGIPTIGLGIGQIYDGVTNNGQANLPSSVPGAIGQAIDKVSGNENKTYENTGDFLDIFIGGKPKNTIETILTVEKILEMGMKKNKNTSNQNNNNQNNNNQNNNNQNNQQTSNKKQSTEQGTSVRVRFIPIQNSKIKVPPADVKNQY